MDHPSPQEAEQERGQGQRIGKRGDIVLQAVIGYGATGPIWLAQDERHDQPVAVKFLQAGADADSVTRARFVREGKIFGTLRHPNIVRVLQLGTHQGRLYLVIEFVDPHV